MFVSGVIKDGDWSADTKIIIAIALSFKIHMQVRKPCAKIIFGVEGLSTTSFLSYLFTSGSGVTLG